MRQQRPQFVLISLTSAVMFGVLAMGPARAEVECKGLEQAQCGGMAGCSWTSAYTRKDGKNVSGYCKRVAVRGDAAATRSAPQKAPAVKETQPKPVVKGTPPANTPYGAATGAAATPAKTPYGQGTGTGAGTAPR